MNGKFVFLSEGKINFIQNEKVTVLSSSIVESYKKKLKEINMKNEWKTIGTGARFMGTASPALGKAEVYDEKLNINSITRYGKEMIAYSLNSGNVGGLYVKSTSNPEEPEVYIFVKEKIRFYDIDFDDAANKIVASTADSYLERHLALVDVNGRDFAVLTEGESYDSNPAWSRKDKNIIYYDSCGLGYDGNQNFVRYGPKSIFRLDIDTGGLEEILTDDKYDLYKPFEDSQGNLFCIRRPYHHIKKDRMPLIDILLIPVKIFKAIFGWLNFFTQRYSGESLKTSGGNPAKMQQKSPEQIFVDGNLIEAEKTLKQNESRGEKHPGYAPSNWELIVKKSSGEEMILKKGVLDYCVLEDGVVLYSNGKYIIKLKETGNEEKIAKVHLASQFINFDNIST